MLAEVRRGGARGTDRSWSSEHATAPRRPGRADPAPRVRHLAADGRRRARGRARRAGHRLPPHRHRARLRERAGGRAGIADSRRRPRAISRHHEGLDDEFAAGDVERRGGGLAAQPPARPRRPAAAPLAQPRGAARGERSARSPGCARTAGSRHARRLELPRRAAASARWRWPRRWLRPGRVPPVPRPGRAARRLRRDHELTLTAYSPLAHGTVPTDPDPEGDRRRARQDGRPGRAALAARPAARHDRAEGVEPRPPAWRTSRSSTSRSPTRTAPGSPRCPRTGAAPTRRGRRTGTPDRSGRPTAYHVHALGAVAEWLRSGLQSRVHRFDSGRRLCSRARDGGRRRARANAPTRHGSAPAGGKQ